ncbi:2,4-dihydroxyhept-2-ene-1,7-dioic acid aldolase-like protein [Cadophora sp. DSE1049]|nr:2,4-dihydroxyhept-2-ene-1,7-dioic acid aldolase-like protein [Cadophora sp. DSE1049]
MSLFQNNLVALAAQDKVCTAFGVKLVAGGEIVQIAKSAGYDSLFIDTEHTVLTIKDVGQLCITALLAGVTPFVRVPHQCGSGQIQKVLDAGAIGVIIPHIHTPEDARKVIQASKYPPMGKRSLTGMLPHYNLAAVPASQAVEQVNASGSTVFIMIETADALACVDELAALPGCDVLMVGSNDLAAEIGTLGDWDSEKFIEALRKVGEAAKKHGKIFGIAGLYHRNDILDRVVNEFGCRWVVGAVDASLLMKGASENATLLRSIQK